MATPPNEGRCVREVLMTEPLPGTTRVREGEDQSAVRSALLRLQAAQQAEAARAAAAKSAGAKK